MASGQSSDWLRMARIKPPKMVADAEQWTALLYQE
jgi:hypothetical protein